METFGNQPFVSVHEFKKRIFEQNDHLGPRQCLVAYAEVESNDSSTNGRVSALSSSEDRRAPQCWAAKTKQKAATFLSEKKSQARRKLVVFGDKSAILNQK